MSFSANKVYSTDIEIKNGPNNIVFFHMMQNL